MAATTLRLEDRKILVFLFDFLLINLTSLLALGIHARRTFTVFNWSFVSGNLIWFVLFTLLWLIFLAINGSYERSNMADFQRALRPLMTTAFFVFFFYLIIFFFSVSSAKILPRGIVLYQSISCLLVIAIWRYVYSALAKRFEFRRKVIIIGAGWAGRTIAQAILEHAPHDYSIMGFVDDGQIKQGQAIEISVSYPGKKDEKVNNSNQSTLEGLRVLGGSVNLVQLVQEYSVEEVVIAITHDISGTVFQAILDCKELGIQITPMPVLYEQLTGRIPIEHIGDNWYVALPLDSAASGIFFSAGKRIFDLIGAMVGITVLLPFFPLIAIAIYLDSPGPIFYTQPRVGKGGDVFNLIKLRTMIPEAEKTGAERALVNDPRVTRMGRFLRKVRLDEMPQLINILKGEMSAVGPRPERPEHLEELNEIIPFHRLRNAVKPGMAGWAVVNYGYIESLEDAKVRLQYDLYYVKHQSLWLDFLIFSRMLWQIITMKGR